MNDLKPVTDGDLVDHTFGDQIAASTDSARKRALKKFGLAAIGAIPWVGGFLVAMLELRENPNKIDELQRQWLEHHAEKLRRLQATLVGIAERLKNFGNEINERIESPEFLAIVDNGFRAWDEAATAEKRDFVRRLLTNSAASSLCSDDLIRLFLNWIRKYDDTHFRVIEAIFKRKGISRRDIWLSMHPSVPRDTSSEADLFKLLIHDLSLGHVIRQHRAETLDGQFVRESTRGRPKTRPSSTLKSPFDSDGEYELTELGERFVHYVMNEVVPQIGETKPSASQSG